MHDQAGSKHKEPQSLAAHLNQSINSLSFLSEASRKAILHGEQGDPIGQKVGNKHSTPPTDPSATVSHTMPQLVCSQRAAGHGKVGAVPAPVKGQDEAALGVFLSRGAVAAVAAGF